MINNESLEFDVTVRTKDGIVIVQMQTAYGPITFSYNPDEVAKGISKLASDLLDKLDGANSDDMQTLAENMGTPLDEVRKNLEAYNARVQEVPDSALEQFAKGRRPYPQGTLEQFMDNLPLTIMLMLSHQATAALMRTTVDLDEQRKTNLHKSADELSDLISKHLKQAIAQLWERPTPDSKVR